MFCLNNSHMVLVPESLDERMAEKQSLDRHIEKLDLEYEDLRTMQKNNRAQKRKYVLERRNLIRVIDSQQQRFIPTEQSV